jgi:hypothetical protein
MGAAHGSRRGRDPHKAAKPTGCEPFSAGAEQTTPRLSPRKRRMMKPALAANYTRSSGSIIVSATIGPPFRRIWLCG